MTEKLCINCKHFRASVDYWCARPEEQDTNLITGKREMTNKFTLCVNERLDSEYLDVCGVAGKYYEEHKSFMSKVYKFLFG